MLAHNDGLKFPWAVPGFIPGSRHLPAVVRETGQRQDLMKVGIIGCGNISPQYFKGGENAANLDIVACADLDHEKAKMRAQEFDCDALSVADLLAISDIELVVNLTVPVAHVEVGLQILQAGKHAYSEKPFAVDLQDGRKLLSYANDRNLKLGCAPDTFLGGGIQTARKVLDDDLIGDVISGTAVWSSPGHERWHPSPAFYYDVGGGPMLDMGPYYITALVNLLGPVESVAGFSSRFRDRRVATSEKARDLEIEVKVDTHVTGVIRFRNGALVSVIMSFDTVKSRSPLLELHGTEGSLLLPDPNGTSGPVRLFRLGAEDWAEVPLAYPKNARMIGVVDMVAGIEHGRPHRANGELALHVLEVMLAFEESSRAGRHIEITSDALRPAALPLGLAAWQVDAA